MSRQKSPLLITLGTACIVIGGLGTLCGTCGAGATVFVLSMNKTGAMAPVADQFRYLDTQTPSWRIVEIGKPLIHLLISFVLIAAGIGLLYRKPWARWAVLACALVNIPLHIGYAVYELVVLMPAQQAFLKTNLSVPKGAAPPPPGFAAGSEIGMEIGATFWILASVGLLVGMLVPTLAKELMPYAKRRRQRDFEDELDDDYLESRFDDDEFENPGNEPRRSLDD